MSTKLQQQRPMAQFLIGFIFQMVPGVMIVPVITLGLAAQGVEAWLIGALATVGSVSYMVALPATPALMRRIGEQTAFRAAVLAGAVANLGLALTSWPALWVGLYALAGVAAGVRFTLAESWVAALAPPATRGRTMAIFQTGIGAAAFVGAGLLLITGVEGAAPRTVIIGATLAGLALLWPVRPPPQPATQPDERPPLEEKGGSMRNLGITPTLRNTLIQVGPLVLGASLISGFFESGLWVTLPLYGLAAGLSPTMAVGLVTALGLGSLSQYPYGALADRFAWRHVTIGAVGMVAVSALLLPLAHAWPGLLLLLGVVWGSAGGGLYTLATIRNGARYRGAQLVGASVVTQLAYMVGEAVGPTLSGLAIDLAPRYGLPALLIAAGVGGLGLMIWSPGRARAGVPQGGPALPPGRSAEAT